MSTVEASMVFAMLVLVFGMVRIGAHDDDDDV
jgi:hypothetical protein